MSYLMDYGPDHPPTVSQQEIVAVPEHEPMTLAQRCGTWTALIAVLYAVCALWLHFDPPPDLVITFPAAAVSVTPSADSAPATRTRPGAGRP